VRQLTGAHRQDARWPAPPAVVPIPLHPRRLRARGFNPAGLLASEIARRNDVRTVFDWLVRLRDTPPQAGLGRRARHANVEGAFACRPLRGATPERIWLVDDVVTTGATLRAAARALCDAGVREVFALCAARTPSRGPRVDSEPGSS
jgi:ComF family protein